MTNSCFFKSDSRSIVLQTRDPSLYFWTIWKFVGCLQISNRQKRRPHITVAIQHLHIINMTTTTESGPICTCPEPIAKVHPKLFRAYKAACIIKGGDARIKFVWARTHLLLHCPGFRVIIVLCDRRHRWEVWNTCPENREQLWDSCYDRTSSDLPRLPPEQGSQKPQSLPDAQDGINIRFTYSHSSPSMPHEVQHETVSDSDRIAEFREKKIQKIWTFFTQS